MEEITKDTNPKIPIFKVITTKEFSDLSAAKAFAGTQGEVEILLPEGLSSAELDGLIGQFGSHSFSHRAYVFMQAMNAISLENLQAILDNNHEELEVIGGEADFPPMWGTLWETEYLPSISGLSEDEVAEYIYEFAGVTVYELNGSFYLGIDGAGYDFYLDHWIPLAYLYGVLS